MSPLPELDALFKRLDAGERIEEIMRDDERARGWTVILPGDVSWLPVEDWEPSVVVAQKGQAVRLVAVIARRPGSLTRLLAALNERDFIPHIVEPTREMRATLQRWGWRQHFEGSGYDAEEFWTPGNSKNPRGAFP